MNHRKLRPPDTDLMAGSALEHFSANSQVVEAVGIHKLLAVSVAITKTLFSHHMPELVLVRAHPGIHIIIDDRNVTFLLTYLEILSINS